MAKTKVKYRDRTLAPENKGTASRRKFLTGAAGAVAGGAALVAAPNVSRAQTTTLKMQSSFAQADILFDFGKEWVEIVHGMVGSRLKIDLLASGAVVGAFQVMDAVHQGVLDGGHGVPVYWYGKNKAASLFGTGPVFGSAAAQNLAWMLKGGGKELYRELTQDILGLDVVGFFCFPMEPQPLGWFKKEVKSADDMKGLKYRTVGLAADLMQAMGMAVAQLPGGEIVPAMEKGVIDAFEFNNPSSDSRFGAQDVAKNYMLSSYHQATEFIEITFNKDVFDGLDPELQKVLEHATNAASQVNYATAMDQYSADLQKLIDEHGVNVKRTPDTVLQAQLEAWDEILPKLMEDEFFAKVVESQKQWTRRVVYYLISNEIDKRLAFNHAFPGVLNI